jgi:hypothetical protein
LVADLEGRGAALQVLCMLVGSAAGTITTAVATGKDRA